MDMHKNVLLMILILLSGTLTDFTARRYHSPRRIEGIFTFEMIADQKNIDKNIDLQYWLPLPTGSEFQQNIEIQFLVSQPVAIDSNSAGDLKIGYWDFSRQKSGQSCTVKIGIKADLYRADYFLDPEMVPDDYAEAHDLVDRYTKSDSLAFVTPEMIELASELTRPVADPFLKARNIYRWILQHLEPQFPIVQRGTRFLFSHPLDSKRDIYGGDSAEYSRVFVALCRAAGFPARTVTGFLVKPGRETPHSWAEFYLPRWGWLPADPFLGDSKERLYEMSRQYDEYFYLGHLDNYHLAFYKGSNFSLQPACPYSHPPYIVNNIVWYAPVGIWNFNKISNAGANFQMTFDGLVVNKYENLRYGIALDFPDDWLQQPRQELGPYLLKERFWSGDKSMTLDFMGRKLPAALDGISSRQAAHREIAALKKLHPDYRIVTEESVDINQQQACQFTAVFNDSNKTVKEYRCYIVVNEFLFWFIGSAGKKLSENNLAKFQAIVKTLKINLPEGGFR